MELSARKENLILAGIKAESEAYQALSELRREASNASFPISQTVIVKQEEQKLGVSGRRSFRWDDIVGLL